uniref:Hsp70 family protein n=1 Tax=Panagrolaimus davidi TaxID=227884 RepID=A0A914P1G6_9BILA
MPYFNIVYSLLNEASNYHPLTEAFGIDLGTSRSALAVHRFHENADILDVVPDQRDAESLLYSWAKNAMKEAAKLANIEVLRFIPEPTAAALSYCSEMRRQLNDNEKIFVFDLGGGTFDISIFNVNNAKLIELCQHSNLKLGGSNFDNILFNYAKETFLKEHELDLTYKENDLFIKSIIAKEALTESEFTNINFQKYINDNDDEVDVDITREKFQDLSESLLDELKEDVDKALQKAHLNANDITLVIKVGGSCAMPMIRSLIVDIFQNAEVNFGDPQHEVAKGAALYAASILPQKE